MRPNERGVDEKTLLDCVRHEGVMRELADGSAGKKEVEEAAGVSGSTAYRLLGSLVDRGLAEKEGAGAYRLTPVGEAVLDETSRFCETVERIVSMRKIVSSTQGTGVDFDPSLFKHGIVTISENKEPYAPARRLAGLTEEREEDGVRLLAASGASAVFFGGQQLPEPQGKRFEVVCPKTVADNCLEGSTEEKVTGTEDAVSVRVHEDPPLTVALFDERVAVGAHDSEKGTLEVLVDTGSREAYGWCEGVYERYKDESDAYL